MARPLIHLRDLKGPAIIFRVVCGPKILRLPVGDKWTLDASKVTCPDCKKDCK